VKVGDLISDKEFPDELGLVIDVKDRRWRTPYLVLCPNGKAEWFSKKYIETRCEVVSESR
jgi:hypothetical protein